LFVVLAGKSFEVFRAMFEAYPEQRPGVPCVRGPWRRCRIIIPLLIVVVLCVVLYTEQKEHGRSGTDEEIRGRHFLKPFLSSPGFGSPGLEIGIWTRRRVDEEEQKHILVKPVERPVLSQPKADAELDAEMTAEVERLRTELQEKNRQVELQRLELERATAELAAHHKGAAAPTREDGGFLAKFLDGSSSSSGDKRNISVEADVGAVTTNDPASAAAAVAAAAAVSQPSPELQAVDIPKSLLRQAPSADDDASAAAALAASEAVTQQPSPPPSLPPPPPPPPPPAQVAAQPSITVSAGGQEITVQIGKAAPEAPPTSSTDAATVVPTAPAGTTAAPTEDIVAATLPPLPIPPSSDGSPLAEGVSTGSADSTVDSVAASQTAEVVAPSSTTPEAEHPPDESEEGSQITVKAGGQEITVRIGESDEQKKERAKKRDQEKKDDSKTKEPASTVAPASIVTTATPSGAVVAPEVLAPTSPASAPPPAESSPLAQATKEEASGATGLPTAAEAVSIAPPADSRPAAADQGTSTEAPAVVADSKPEVSKGTSITVKAQGQSITITLGNNDAPSHEDTKDDAATTSSTTPSAVATSLAATPAAPITTAPAATAPPQPEVATSPPQPEVSAGAVIPDADVAALFAATATTTRTTAESAVSTKAADVGEDRYANLAIFGR